MEHPILAGSLLIALTSLFHLLLTKVMYIVAKQTLRYKDWRRYLWLELTILLLILTAFIESSIWALHYFRIGALETLEEAMYFSIVTYTTLGYGDITLDVGDRLFGAIEAANGTIMFGWSTALFVWYIQKFESHNGNKS